MYKSSVQVLLKTNIQKEVNNYQATGALKIEYLHGFGWNWPNKTSILLTFDGIILGIWIGTITQYNLTGK